MQTPFDIATQHSGLPRLPTNFAPADEENPYADYGPEQLKTFLAGYTLTRDPGASSAADEFFVRGIDIRLSFEREAQHKVKGLVLHQSGDRVAPRLSAGEIDAAANAIKLDVATLRDYVGKYQVSANATFDITLKDDQLYLQYTGESAFVIYALSQEKDRFVHSMLDAQADFERDNSGQVVALIWHQNGHNDRAARLKP